jgi:hypothetical protein
MSEIAVRVLDSGALSILESDQLENKVLIRSLAV